MHWCTFCNKRSIFAIISNFGLPLSKKCKIISNTDKFFVTLSQMSDATRHIELLAPAKDYLSAVDAIDCGADAVYIGGAKFGARYAAGNSVEEIARVAEYAHRFGVRVYATCNTLLFEEEVEEAREQALSLIEAGVDALIVQDMAYARMGLPIELHASTQTSCTESERVRFFEQVGFSRAILERSLSLNQIREIRRNTSIELEAFIHGAICVCQSGRCFLSRSTSPRSGNRGECSQPCRLPYDLTDGRGSIYIKGKHLLSVRDLDLSARLGEMLDAGITSFKIEGRLKDRVYLRNTVSHYRRLLDREIALRSDCRRASEGVSHIEFEPNPAKSFTRGASEYMLDGKQRGVASFDTPKAIGESIGIVKSLRGRGFTLDRSHDLCPGDGICYISDGEAVGTNINSVDALHITPNRMEGLRVGMEIFRSYNRLFSTTVERSRLRRSVEARLELSLLPDTIRLRAYDGAGNSVEQSIEHSYQEAKDGRKMYQTTIATLKKSGDTIFDISDIKVFDGESECQDCVRGFVPASLLASLRREVLQQLDEQRTSNHRRGVPFVEELSARYPATTLSEQENVTNSLARKFYADHGVVQIAEGLDCKASTEGYRVMLSDYCIRREIGQCLLKEPTIKGPLFLERGRKRYRLEFDCKRCQMSLYDCL